MAKRILFILLISTSFISCFNKDTLNLVHYEKLVASLDRSNSTIKNHTISIEKSLEQKLAAPLTAEKTLYWYQRARAIRIKSLEIIKYIDSLKYQIQLLSKSNELDIKIVSEFFENKGNGQQLNKKLQNFIRDILLVDPEITSTFESRINQIMENNKVEQTNFTKLYFGNLPPIAAVSMLLQFENNIAIIENELIVFCDNKIPNISSLSGLRI